MRGLLAVCGFVVVSCAGPKGEDGANGAEGARSLVALTPEPAGANCPAGGTKVEAGLDANGNGTLDASEVSQTQYICSVEGPAPVTLVRVRNEPPGGNCTSGGTAIESGVDADRNGTLDPGEVISTQYVCNGAATASVALVATAAISGPPCAHSGVAIRSGLDTNGNGALDVAEVQSTAYVCDGRDGDAGIAGLAALTRVVAESAGANCASGGQAVQVGVDTNGNGALDAAEVTSTSYVCNGQAGIAGPAGAATLVVTGLEPAGANCPLGGQSIRSGVDANANGQLDAPEVTQTAYVCNGATGSAGLQSLVTQAPEPAGSNCASGGTAIRSGLDANGDGTLGVGEVTSTTYVCNGPTYFQSGWQGSFLGQLSTGELPPGYWQPVGRNVTVFKVRNDTRLKITVTDNVRFGYGATGSTSGTYAVLLGGAWINCYRSIYSANGSGAPNNFHYPLSFVCIIPAWNAGLYEFQSHVIAGAGTSYVGWSAGDAQVLVEEMTDSRYGFSLTDEEAVATSPTWVQAPQRDVTYVKQSASTLLKLTLADSFIGTHSAGEGRVVVRMDGADTTCSMSTWDFQGGLQNVYDSPLTMTCVLTNVSVGSHAFSVWLSSGNSTDDTRLGNMSNSLLLVEELDPSRVTYVNGPSYSGDIGSGAFAQVTARTLTINVATAGIYKFTYSDTFRPAGTCNGASGFYEVYVNGQPTGLNNAMHCAGGNAVQDHYRGINHTSMWSLSPGTYTFTIWGRADCGANSFGWQRGQVLLMAERMP